MNTVAGTTQAAAFFRRAAVACMLMAASLPAQPLAAQTAPPGRMQTARSVLSQPDWQFRLDLFQFLLAQRGIAVTRSADQVLNRPNQSLIVVAGDLERVPTALRLELAGFVRRGGALLAASDLNTSLPGLFSIRQGPVIVHTPSLQYEGFADCPRVSGLSRSHDLTTGVRELIANRCGWIDTLSQSAGYAAGVADLPREARATQGDPSGRSLIATLESDHSRSGRMVVMADHSLLTSGMMLHGDNAILAVNLVKWLGEGRRQALILVHGQLIQGGTLELNPDRFPQDLSGPPPQLDDLSQLPPESLLEFANQFVTAFEEANLPNELATGYFQSLPRPYYRRLLYLAAAVVGIIWLLRQLFRRGAEVVPAISRPVGTVSQQRAHYMLMSEDYQIAAREMSRHLFRQLSGSSAVGDWPTRYAELQVEGSLAEKFTVARHWKGLRRLATGDAAGWLSRRRFLKLSAVVDHLLTLNANGTLSVRPSSDH